MPSLQQAGENESQTVVTLPLYWRKPRCCSRLSAPIQYSGLLMPSSNALQFGKYLFIQLKSFMLFSDPESLGAIHFILLMEMGIVTSEIKFDTLKIESVLAKCRIQLIFESVLDFLRCIYKVVSGNVEFLNNLPRHLAEKFGTSFLQETSTIIFIFYKCQKRIENYTFWKKVIYCRVANPGVFISF